MGYVIIDHTQSLPSIQKQFGGGKIEYDCLQCKHCGGVLKVLHRQHTGLYCMPCGGPVHDTPQCAKHNGTWLQKLLKEIARRNFLTSIGLG